MPPGEIVSNCDFRLKNESGFRHFGILPIFNSAFHTMADI